MGIREQEETPRLQQEGVVGSDRADNVPDLVGGRGLSELSDSESTGGRLEQDSTAQVAKNQNYKFNREVYFLFTRINKHYVLY